MFSVIFRGSECLSGIVRNCQGTPGLVGSVQANTSRFYENCLALFYGFVGQTNDLHIVVVTGKKTVCTIHTAVQRIIKQMV